MAAAEAAAAATVRATTVASQAIFRVIAPSQGRVVVAVDVVVAAAAAVTATTVANQVTCREIAPSRERSAGAAAAAAAVECSASSAVDTAIARPTAEIDIEDDCPKPGSAPSAQRIIFFRSF